MSRRAWSAFAFMSVVWGASYLLIKIAINGGLPAADVAWLRVAVAAAILLGFVLRRGALRSLRPAWRWILGYAVAEIAIPFPLIAVGEVHVASSLAAIIIASVPLLVTVLSLRFDPSERPTLVRGVGLVVGFAGVIALVGLDFGGNGAQLLGAGAVFIGAVGYAVGPMLIKLGMRGLDSAAVMGASLLVGAVLLAPFAGADLPRRAPTAGAWAAVAALGVFCTAVAFVVYTLLIREAGTSRATVITYVNPLVAVVLGVTLLGEQPGGGAFIGLVLILAGSWVSTGGSPAGLGAALRGPRRGSARGPRRGPARGPRRGSSAGRGGAVAGAGEGGADGCKEPPEPGITTL